MPNYRVPVVGMHFRPPAKAILQVLPLDFPLGIEMEPDNEHDPNAIKVIVKSEDLPKDSHSTLDTLAQGFGFSAADILAQPEWHLGYVKATSAAELAGFLGGSRPSHRYTSGKLAFDMEGKPILDMQIDPA